MKTDSVQEYELLLKQLLYQNRMLQSSRPYRLGKRLLLITRLLKQGKLATLYRTFYNKFFFARVHKKFDDLPPAVLSAPDEKIAEISLPAAYPTVTVYTCITGNYDKPLAPLVHYSNCRYLLFTDDVTRFANTPGWTVCPLPAQARTFQTPAQMNRYLKFHPQAAAQTDYAVYIDGNIRLLTGINDWLSYARNSSLGVAIFNHPLRNCLYREGEVCLYARRGNGNGIKAQLARYQKEGMPKNYGLKEASVIVSDLANGKAADLLEKWWQEYLKSESGRDQLALPYVLWKNQLAFDAIGCLGKNLTQDIHLTREGHV